MSLKSNKLLLEVCWQFPAQQCPSVKRKSILPQFQAGIGCTNLCDVSGSCALYFIASCNWNSKSFSSSTETQHFPIIILGNILAWGQWKITGWSLHLSAPDFVVSTFVQSLPRQCTVIIHFLGTVNHNYFKSGIVTLPDPIWKTSCTCGPLLYVVCHFTKIMNDLQCSQVRIKNATACSVLSFVYPWQLVNACLGLAAQSGEWFIHDFKTTPTFLSTRLIGGKKIPSTPTSGSGSTKWSENLRGKGNHPAFMWKWWFHFLLLNKYLPN
jgi:hypothetical protein